MSDVRPDSPEGVAAAAARIAEVLAGLPPDQRAAIDDLRARVEAVAPEAVPAISYAMPAYRYRGRPLVSYAAFKDHCSFFPMGPDVVEPYREALEGFIAAKGTIHFWPDRPLPPGTVEGIVRARLAQIDAKRR
jgi:uncharacterized protein YdhG (YjbR/CyaY superfamily)